MKRSLIKELTEFNVSKISGIIEKVRDTKYMIFIVLKDRSGHIQVSIDKQNEELASDTLKLTVGSNVSFTGVMQLSEYVKDGGKEFVPTNVEILSIADVYPIDDNALIDKKTDYRWIDLRGEKQTLTFQIQSAVQKYIREYLYDNEFMEIHTPKLLGAASESGSDVFEVKYFDRSAYLAQSPQFYKQMAVASGFERVFEIGPVFRAENSNTNRHCTEFTSVDLEFAYIDSYVDVMNLEASLLTYVLKRVKENFGEIIKEKFGREVIVPEKEFPVIKLQDLYLELNKRYGYQIPTEDVGDMNSETEKLACQYAMEEYNSEFIFITDFNKAKRAFYHLRENDVPQGFDLLYRGTEITTGAQREHRYEELLKNVNEKGLGKDVEFYTEFFRYGCAPHGGFAIGLERFTALLLGLDHIRDAQFIFRSPNRLNP